MFHLLTPPPGRTFADTLSDLHDGRLADIFGRTILGRAYDYRDAIESLRIAPGVAEAEIYGTEPCEVVIEYRLGDVYGDCSCPYEAPCKHLAALFMYLRDEADEIGLDAIEPAATALESAKKTPARFDFDAHLEHLSADELRALVRQFAPDSYRRTLAAQHAAPDERQKSLQSAAKRLRDLLKKAHEYGPDDFEAKLLKELDALRPFWLGDTDEALRLLRDVLAGIDEAQGEGYLYDDYSDGSFEGDELARYLAEFIAAQPAETLVSTLQSLVETLDEREYNFADHFFADLVTLLSDAKRRLLLPFFRDTGALAALEDRDQRVVWQYFKPLLNADEQVEMLALLTDNPFFALELADLLEREGDVGLGIRELDKALKNKQLPQGFWRVGFFGGFDKSKLYERRIEVEKRQRAGRKLDHWTDRYVRECATAQSLHFALQ